jgi:4-coumarate--CoA ligase
MPVHSRWEIPIEHGSLQKFLFKSPTASLPDKKAFIDSERPETHFLTQDSFRSWSARLAVGLRKAGLEPGDRVLLFAGNSILFPIVFMGVVMAGGIFTGANPGFVERELAYQLKDADPKFLICSDAALEIGISATKSVGMKTDQIFVFDNLLFEGTGAPRLGVQNWNNLIAAEYLLEGFEWYEPEDPKEAIIALNYSSGTTGPPKGVMISHYAYVANTTHYNYLATLNTSATSQEDKLYYNSQFFVYTLVTDCDSGTGFALDQCTMLWHRQYTLLAE